MKIAILDRDGTLNQIGEEGFIGSAEAWNALFERAGFVVVNSIEALMETASFFAKVPYAPVSRGVAAIGASGGALIAATDAAEAAAVGAVAAAVAEELFVWGVAGDPGD